MLVVKYHPNPYFKEVTAVAVVGFIKPDGPPINGTVGQYRDSWAVQFMLEGTEAGVTIWGMPDESVATKFRLDVVGILKTKVDVDANFHKFN